VNPEQALSGVSLRLLSGVTYAGTPVTGERARALLAALALASGSAVSSRHLVSQIWGEEEPASPHKALQVLVSRVRSQTAAEVVERAGDGYRLGLAPSAVDALVVADLAIRSVRAEAAGQVVAARDAAREALTAGGASQAEAGTADGPIGDLRARAVRDLAAARVVLGRCASATGDHALALPLLEAAADADEATLAALLRSEAAVRGAPSALRRYEAHREAVRDQLGVGPGPLLQAVHSDLLAADNPVRSGLHFETTSLVGRDADIRALRSLVREARVTSIVGPGGIGKTRLAHLMGREAEQPVVHFVELVGVLAPEDVVGEVGSALGVRDSLSTQHVLSPEQRSDIRARTAQALDRAPTLLVLDNCEHVVGAAADLVAFLVSTVAQLRVVTTTRAPLAIAAERVFPLGQLATDDAVELFEQRARSARPDVGLPTEQVRRVVDRLDGLPLAIELAAAKVRVMSVEDIGRRLDDRFALLRGGDRSAPDRHRTLLAVIDWSWNLLAEPERRALRWLSLFHDGFTLAAADALLGQDALDVVQSLVAQSLLAVVEARGSVRFRMLETVREFGRLRLADAGDADAARAAQVAWGTAYADGAATDLYSPRQVEVLAGLRAEENNLADLLREAMTRRDQVTTAALVAALAGLWTISGDFPRLMALSGSVEAVLSGWDPPPGRVESAVAAICVMALNSAAISERIPPGYAQALADHGDRVAHPVTRAMVRLLDVLGEADPRVRGERARALQDDSDRGVASLALLWSVYGLENDGDPVGAIALAERALEMWRDDDGPWGRASLETQLAMLSSQVGRSADAERHGRAALPLLDRLEAFDDAAGVRSVLAYAAMADGRLDDARRLVDEVAESQRGRPALVPWAVIADAELALALGDRSGGLAAYRSAMERLRGLRFPGLDSPSGLEPWTLFGESAAAMAYAVYGSGTEGVDVFAGLRDKMPAALDPARQRLDYPIAGLVLFALGGWGLLRDALPVADAVRLVALADGFGYNRAAPCLAWGRVAALAERRAPGQLEQALAENGDRHGPGLLEEARAVAARLG
jgi:predicted ATPase/DNA-binding SARP family transcriptional activator